MFAAIQNEKIIYCYENELLCEAFARGFQTIDELRLWESELPCDSFGVPVRPAAPFEIRRLEGALLEEYLRLAQEGYRPGEIYFIHDPGPELPGGENEKDPHGTISAPDPVAADGKLPDGEGEAEIPIASKISQTRRLTGDPAALERRQSRAAWDAVRDKRNTLLDASDKYMLPDFPIDDGQRALWRSYRERLREVTKDFASPDAVEWPASPA